MIKARIAGHPLHIMLIHFPSALYPLSVICSTLFFFKSNPIQGHVAFYCMVAGVAMGWLSAIAGLLEALLIPSDKSKAIETVFVHASLNAAVTIGFTIWAILAWKLYPEVVKDSSLLLVSKWIAIMVLIIGNYMGGKLLLEYNVGISEGTKKRGEHEFKIDKKTHA